MRWTHVSRLASAAVLLLAAPAWTAEPSPPIREFPISTLEAMGREIAAHDAAAWVATDALRARVPDLANSGLRGWVILDAPGGKRVRFLRDTGNGLEAGYDIHVTSRLRATVSEPGNRQLSSEERARFAAFTAAGRALAERPTCRPGYNNVVLKDPEGDGWIVWFLAPMTELGTIPAGGHYRFSVSADGSTVTRIDALSNSCLIVPKPPPEAKGAVAFVTNIVSPKPLETHVFLQLQARQGMVVAAGEHMWSIEDGRIVDRGRLPDNLRVR